MREEDSFYFGLEVKLSTEGLLPPKPEVMEELNNRLLWRIEGLTLTEVVEEVF